MRAEATVMGIPRPQGSKRMVGNGRFIESNADVLVPWRDSVASALAEALPAGWDPEGAFSVTAVFTWSHLKTRRRRYKASPPDIDKLLRAVLDAGTYAGAWRDDGAVVEIRAVKVYAELPGLRLVIDRKEEL